jgi:glycerol uptake facilitator-like aquaporin
VQFFWGLHLIPAHIALNTLPCQAGLQCTMIYGAIMEAFISFISRIVALETTSCVQSISAVANSVTTVALCIFALDSSGGFFNPILASALTLNCKGNNFVEHFFVYWAGSLVGGVVARTLHLIVHRKATLVAKEKDD